MGTGQPAITLIYEKEANGEITATEYGCAINSPDLISAAIGKIMAEREEIRARIRKLQEKEEIETAAVLPFVASCIHEMINDLPLPHSHVFHRSGNLLGAPKWREYIQDNYAGVGFWNLGPQAQRMQKYCVHDIASYYLLLEIYAEKLNRQVRNIIIKTMLTDLRDMLTCFNYNKITRMLNSSHVSTNNIFYYFIYIIIINKYDPNKIEDCKLQKLAKYNSIFINLQLYRNFRIMNDYPPPYVNIDLSVNFSLFSSMQNQLYFYLGYLYEMDRRRFNSTIRKEFILKNKDLSRNYNIYIFMFLTMLPDVELPKYLWRMGSLPANLSQMFFPEELRDIYKIIKKMLKTRPGDTWLVGNIYTMHMASGRRKEAIRLIEQLYANDPASSSYLLTLIYKYLEYGNIEAAHKYSLFLRAKNDLPDSIACQAAVLLRMGRTRETDSLLAYGLAKYPDSDAIADMMCDRWREAGQWQKVKQLCVKRLAVNPVSGWAWRHLAAAANREGRTKRAAALIRSGMRKNPAALWYGHNLCIYLFKLKLYDEIKKVCSQALALLPNIIWAYRWLADAAYAQGDLNGAIRHIRRALAIDSCNAWFHEMLSKYLSEKGFRDEAYLIAQKAEQLNPEMDWIYVRSSECLLAKGDLPEAIRALRKGAALKPDSPSIRQELCQTFADRGLWLPLEQELNGLPDAIKNADWARQLRESAALHNYGMDIATGLRLWIAAEPDNPQPSRQMCR